jgi:hypothetical protein
VAQVLECLPSKPQYYEREREREREREKERKQECSHDCSKEIHKGTGSQRQGRGAALDGGESGKHPLPGNGYITGDAVMTKTEAVTVLAFSPVPFMC